jgi:hypothetical protein
MAYRIARLTEILGGIAMLVRYSTAPPETASPMLSMDDATMLRGSERRYYSQFGLTADEGEWLPAEDGGRNLRSSKRRLAGFCQHVVNPAGAKDIRPRCAAGAGGSSTPIRKSSMIIMRARTMVGAATNVTAVVHTDGKTIVASVGSKPPSPTIPPISATRRPS